MERAQKSSQQSLSLRPFGIKDKFGYMLGDVGNDLFFSLVSGYLMLFYTDVLGITAGAVGTMLIIARIWDAINDVMMGTFIDSRKVGPKGKFRPYLLYAALPVTIMGFLTFTLIPGISENMKLVYAYITYIGFGMCYTAINIPYGSLASVMTTDPVERTSLSTWRTMGALVANVFIMIIAPKLIFVNDVPTAAGFIKVVALFVILSNLCYFGAFKLTTERVKHEVNPNAEKISFTKSVKGLLKNRALIGIMLASFGMLSSMMAVQALTPYLYKDYFKAPELITLAGITGMLASFIVLPFLGPLVKKFGKKELVSYSMVIGIVGNIALFLMPISDPYVFMAINFVASLGVGFFNVLIWALVSDVIDYQEYITGKREEGIVYASYSLVRKLGQAVAGGIGGFALTFVGYQSGVAAQSEQVANGIKQVITVLPLVTIVIAFISMVFVYNLSKTKLAEVDKELRNRRGEC
ncbi:MFS transporter [Romboutsia sp.]|uniref:MFS transporter n=1 Tax=Romboutsia sp. TaxID=1965302 RepID=UPI003F2BFF4B